MSWTRMRYHFVTATRGRAPLITPDIEPVLYEWMRRAAEQSGGRIVEIGGLADHVHLLVAVRPDVAPSEFIGAVKSRTSRKLADDHPEGDGFAWQSGYGGFTVSPHEMGRIRSYVQNQKDHHARDTTWDRLEQVGEP